MTLPKEVYKAHGMGNDFIIYIDLDNEFEPKPSEVRAVCDRHFGIGADGLIRLTKKAQKDGSLRLFMDYSNKDGSLASMCGNGARVCALIADIFNLVNMDNGNIFELDTRSGVKRIVRVKEGEYTIDMGAWSADDDRNFSVCLKGENAGKTVTGRFVNVGNEHIVSDLINKANLRVGVQLGNLDLNKEPSATTILPSESGALVKDVGANYEFTEVDIAKSTIKMRVFERGVGETQSCGTGIVASAISAYLATGQAHQHVDRWRVSVPGGNARVQIVEDHAFLTASALLVGKIVLNEHFSRGLLYANS
ncbi:MAG: diaminopimelate epimerase [Candidatus Ancillula sp.]|jgi:diaminopimelate epimerase|nr:diaminopimelate epimerase [Candidatus Ancillula sp.]